MKGSYSKTDFWLSIVGLVICLFALGLNLKEAIVDNSDWFNVWIFAFLTCTSISHLIVRAKNQKKKGE